MGYEALTDKYGHTHVTLGLFDPHVTLCGETALIRYTISDGHVSAALAGEYFVLITPESAQAFWSHDGADAALWQSGDLNSPAWGAKQLEAYLAEHPYTRADFCVPYEEAHYTTALNGEFAADPTDPVNKDNRESAEAAAAQARAALQVMYDLPADVVTGLDWELDLSTQINYRDGHSEWHLMLQDNTDVLDPITYYVTLDAESHEILRITHFSGGVG